MNGDPIYLEAQANDLALFLASLNIEAPPDDPSLPDDYIVTKINPAASSFLQAHDNSAVLLWYRIQGKPLPVTIVCLKGSSPFSFCHSILLLDSYAGETLMVPLLRDAVQKFFENDEVLLLGKLNPSWENAALKDHLDCRIFWNAKPDITVVTELFLHKFGKVLEIPLFPSVYNYNNPYDQNLLEAALDDLDGCENILLLGTGAGLEAVCVALKYGIPVDAVDINPVAVANTIAASRRTGTDHLVTAWTSDGFKQVEKMYDAILFEAPVATTKSHLQDPNRYDFEGRLLREVLGALPSHLKAGGRMYLMSLPDIATFLPTSGLQSKVLRIFEAEGSLAIHKIWSE